MKDKNILICVGIIIYIAMSGIDRFVYHIPNIIYIPVAILGTAYQRCPLRLRPEKCGLSRLGDSYGKCVSYQRRND